MAADAVVNEQDGYNGRNTEIPIYLDMPRPNRFSPPSKTEGSKKKLYTIISVIKYELFDLTRGILDFPN